MINDFKKGHYYSLFEELPLIKNISYEMDSGKYILLDNKGNNYLCDVFGREKPIFKKNISGFINGEERKVLRRVKSHSNIINSNNYLNFLENKAKEESKSYFPSINRFEGYAQFPRPLCPPFSNIPEYALNENYRKLLVNPNEQNLEVNENKKVFLRPKENSGLSYLTSDIKGYMDKEKEKEKEKNNFYININKKDDKSYIIKMIDNTISGYKIKYKCDFNELIKNHSIIRALLNLKKKLINNNETNIINGRKLKEPNINAINKYKIIYSKLSNYNEQTRIKNEHKRLMKCYSQMNIKKDVNKENSPLYGLKLLKKISINNKKTNEINTNTSVKNYYENKNINKQLFKNINIIQNKNKNDNSFSNKVINDTNNNQNLYDEQETKESIGTKANINLLNFINNTNESHKEDNLSIISAINEKEKSNFINFNKKIKYLKSLKKKSEKEKKLLEGYQKDEPKKLKGLDFIGEEEPPKFRDFGEIYKKEIETLEKLNPILFNLQKKKDDYDLKKMIRKKEFKKLNERVIMKGRKLKINKISSD